MPARKLDCSLSHFSIGAVYKGDAGKHMQEATLSARGTLAVDVFALQVLTSLALALPKLSFLGVYFRILFKKSHRLAVWIVAAFISGNAIATFFVSILMCSPISAAWTLAPSGRCIDIETFLIYCCVYNLVTDIILMLLPIPLIAELQVNRSQKLRLYFMFSLGAM